MDDRVAKAFEFAQDTTKQLITLATAIVAFTVTFIKDIIDSESSSSVRYVEIAWLFYLASILFGIVTLMGLTGNLERPRDATASIYSKNIVVPSLLQITTFFVATVLTVVFGIAET